MGRHRTKPRRGVTAAKGARLGGLRHCGNKEHAGFFNDQVSGGVTAGHRPRAPANYRNLPNLFMNGNMSSQI